MLATPRNHRSQQIPSCPPACTHKGGGRREDCGACLPNVPPQVNEEVKRYNSILSKLTDAASDEWEPIVSVYRGDLQRGFFEHMQVRL